MRYRMLATYRGVPYEAGVGPSGADVVLFAACPPPEELGFEPATGHWRKKVIRAEIDALWESRPVGTFGGEPCIVLDDLGDRLHIAYLGDNPRNATRLGYWQIDRGVFELLTPREDVTGLTEERVDRPLRIAPPLAEPEPRPRPDAGPRPGPDAEPRPPYSYPDEPPLTSPGAPGAGPASSHPSGAGSSSDDPTSDDPTGTGLSVSSGSSLSGPSGSAAPEQPLLEPLPERPPAEPSLAGAAQAMPSSLEPSPLAAAPPSPAASEPAATSAGPVQADPVQAGAVQADPVQADAVQADAARAGAVGADAVDLRQPLAARGTPPPPPSAQAAPAEHALSQHTPAGHLPAQHAPAQHADAQHADAQHAPAQDVPSQHVPAQRASASQEMPRLGGTQPGPARHESAHAGRRPKPAENGSRASRRQRVATRDVFCDLADLAGISRAAYALEAEVDGVLCLLPTASGYEVFVSADGARHEVRSFPDEEAAYFYLFGVLVAEAVRNGALTPAVTQGSSV